MPISVCWPLCLPPEPVKDRTLCARNAEAFMASRIFAQVHYTPGDQFAEFEQRTKIYVNLILSGMLVFGEKGPPGATPMMLWG
jgi:hypothetical protein